MKIYIANDHRGAGLKIYMQNMLVADGHEVENLGTDNPDVKVDYPDAAALVAEKLSIDPTARGILICGTGTGMVIAANRFRHIRATRCERPEQAKADRLYCDTNVLAFGADDIDPEVAFLTAQAFLESPFDAIERRIANLEKIS